MDEEAFNRHLKDWRERLRLLDHDNPKRLYDQPLVRVEHHRFHLYSLDGGSKGRVNFTVDHKEKTVRVEIDGRKPHLDTTIEIGRRLWYLFVAQGFAPTSEICTDCLLNNVALWR